jgi:hypothetical protein
MNKIEDPTIHLLVDYKVGLELATSKEKRGYREVKLTPTDNNKFILSWKSK